MKGFSRIAICLVLTFLMVSCRSTGGTIATHDNSQDTIYIEKNTYDSVYVHDSIWYEMVVKGDTVWKIKEVYKDRWHDRYVHDTTYVSHRDTTTITRTIVTNELTRWQKMQVDFGRLVLIAAVCALVAFALKLTLK